MHVPFSPPDMSESEIEQVSETLKSGWITTGPKTKQFESEIASYCGTPKSVCVNSATAGMELVLRYLGVKEGDNVITSAYTYSASASVIFHVGAEIRFSDIADTGYEMDYDRLDKLIDENTKAIIPVDVGGVPCDYKRLYEIVESKKNLFKPSNAAQEAFGRVVILSDSAHSFGSQKEGVMAGALADFSVFSFHAVKNLTVAEGGAITWKNGPLDNDEMYREMGLLSLHGQSKDALAKTKLDAWEYDILYPAYKCNMTDIMAGIGLAQLSRYGAMLKRRKELLDIYKNELSALPIELISHEEKEYISNKHLLLTQLCGKDISFRNELIEKLAGDDIAANVHYKPLPMMTAYKNLGFDIADFPVSYERYTHELTLPLFSVMSDEQAGWVCECIIKHRK